MSGLSYILCVPGNDPSPWNTSLYSVNMSLGFWGTVFMSSFSSKKSISLMRFSDKHEDKRSIGVACVDTI